MVFGNFVRLFVCLFVFLVSFCLEDVEAVPVIKSYPQDPKLDSEDNMNLPLSWLHEPPLISSFIGTGDLIHPAPFSATTVINQKSTPLATSGPGDKTRAGSEKSRVSSDKNRADSEKTRPSSDKNRTNFHKTRDTLKSVTHPSKRRDESKVVQPPPGLSPELFQLLQQYHQFIRPADERSSPGSGIRITVFPTRRGKQFAKDVVQKVDAIQKIADSSEEDEGNVQKIDRKVDADNSDEKIFDLDAIVEDNGQTVDVESVEGEDLNDAGEDLSLEELLGGNKTDTNGKEADDEDNETIMQKIRQTDCYAIIYLGAFVGLVTCFFLLACSEIFCRNCIDTSNVFLPEAHINESYYRTYHPKPSTPPPPYHLFAPPMYQDIVKDAQVTGKIVQCCPVRTPCPPYRKEMSRPTPQQETQGVSDVVSIIHLRDPCPPYHVTPAAAAYISLLSDTSPGVIPSSETSTKDDPHVESGLSKIVKPMGEVYEVHRVPTEPIVCPCRKQDSAGDSQFQSSPIQSENGFTQSFVSTGEEKPFKNSVSFNERSSFDGQNLFTSDEKTGEKQNQTNCDQSIPSYSNELSTSVEKINETEKSALSAFMKDSREFKNQLKTRIRNSVSFSLSQNCPCSDQLDKQCKHSVSYAEQMDKEFAAMDDLTYRTNAKKQEHSSCFAIDSLHHSIPELIKLSNNTIRSTNNSFVENSHQSYRTGNSGSCHVSQETSSAFSKDSQTENLLESCSREARLVNSPFVLELQEDYNNVSPSNASGSLLQCTNKSDICLHNDAGACERRSSTCDQATNTCYQSPLVSADLEPREGIHRENLKTKIFFIDDLDEEDHVEIS